MNCYIFSVAAACLLITSVCSGCTDSTHTPPCYLAQRMLAWPQSVIVNLEDAEVIVVERITVDVAGLVLVQGRDEKRVKR